MSPRSRNGRIHTTFDPVAPDSYGLQLDESGDLSQPILFCASSGLDLHLTGTRVRRRARCMFTNVSSMLSDRASQLVAFDWRCSFGQTLAHLTVC